MPELEWIKEKQPETHGYYLGVWEFLNRHVVSELWYNPSTGWWPTRGYMGEHHRHGIHEKVEVIAWMPLPSYKP